MPRNAMVVSNTSTTTNNTSHTKQSRGGKSKRTGSNKITIKPFRKPPTLPANYYETTVQQLLDNLQQVLQDVCNTTGRTTTTPPSSGGGWSLQTAYTTVVNLVSHHYGSRLYQDLQTCFRNATHTILPDTMVMDETISNNNNNNDDAFLLLETMTKCYNQYLEFVLVCKHVFLPLDRTHVWNTRLQSAVPIVPQQPTTTWSSSSSAMKQPPPTTPMASSLQTIKSTTTATNDSSSSPQRPFQPPKPLLLTVWQLGIQQFGTRLQELQLDHVLYQQWLSLFLSTWNAPTTRTNNHHPPNHNNDHTTVLTVERTTTNRISLQQQIWYLWQDLGWLSSLPLQVDLERYWANICRQWQDNDDDTTNYKAQAFLQYCYSKYTIVQHTWSPWLPSVWLTSILEHVLLQPHLTTQYLLHPQHLFPLLAQEIASPTTTTLTSPRTMTPIKQQGGGTMANSTTTSTSVHPLSSIQQLWMLAGRLPHGQAQVAAGICAFAKEQGIQRMQPSQTDGTAKSSSTTTTTTTTSSNVKQQQTAVSELLQLQDSLKRLIASLQPHGPELINLKSTWEQVVNLDVEPSIAESLAKFLDGILRNNKKMDFYQNPSNSTTSSDDQWLQPIISGLFVPLAAKDVFEAFYRKDLAKRLLYNRVVNIDAEKQVVSMFKAECGTGYTSKMEGMFQDVDWSRETMMVYKQSNPQALASSPSSVEMEVQILTTGYWPMYPSYPNLILPTSLQEPQERFANHYKTKYQGRRMTWQYALGQCVVRANGFAKAYDLVVNLCQALTLIQFDEDCTTWRAPDLMKAVGLEDKAEMHRILQSLSMGKDGTRILRKLDFDRQGKKKPRQAVDDRDEFVVNDKFESNQRRIRIQNILMKETKEERDKTVEAVSRDRLYLIDAVLVRIMKARKTLLHQQLIPQVLEQVKVPASASDVKKRIESLIEREYLERDAKDRNRYKYLA